MQEENAHGSLMDVTSPGGQTFVGLTAADCRLLADCPLFEGLRGEALENTLRFWDAHILPFRRGDRLSREGGPQPWFGLVLSGAVEVSMDDADGRRMIMAAAQPGDTFGEALHYLGGVSEVHICGMEDGRVLLLRGARLHAPDAPAEALQRFSAMLARRALRMNDRIQVLSRPTIRARVMALFALLVRDSGARSFVLPFGREDMAAYLAVDRSALSRELSKMRREGLVDWEGDRYTLADP